MKQTDAPQVGSGRTETPSSNWNLREGEIKKTGRMDGPGTLLGRADRVDALQGGLNWPGQHAWDWSLEEAETDNIDRGFMAPRTET